MVRVAQPDGPGADGNRKCGLITLLVSQIAIIVIYAMMVRYDHPLNPSTFIRKGEREQLIRKSFMDVHMMLFIGFAYMYSFLRRFACGGVALTLLLGSMVVQWNVIVLGCVFFLSPRYAILVSDQLMYYAEVGTLTVVISMGPVLARATPAQLIVMGLIESPFYTFNYWISTKYLVVMDFNDSVLGHAFGAYFGLAAAFIISSKPSDEEDDNSTDLGTDMLTLFGTLVLWVCWPSWAIINTISSRSLVNMYLAMASSVVFTFIASYAVERGRFHLFHLQRATLAGGVAIGSMVDLRIKPYGAMITGALGAIVSVFGCKWLTPCMSRWLRIPDTAGVHNVHGLPGVLSGLGAALVAWLAAESEYGPYLYRYYPARCPSLETLNGTTNQLRTNITARVYIEIIYEFAGSHLDVTDVRDRTAVVQCMFQLIFVGVSCAIAIVGGLITGVIMRTLTLGKPHDDYLSDQHFFIEDRKQ